LGPNWRRAGVLRHSTSLLLQELKIPDDGDCASVYVYKLWPYYKIRMSLYKQRVMHARLRRMALVSGIGLVETFGGVIEEVRQPCLAQLLLAQTAAAAAEANAATTATTAAAVARLAGRLTQTQSLGLPEVPH